MIQESLKSPIPTIIFSIVSHFSVEYYRRIDQGSTEQGVDQGPTEQGVDQGPTGQGVDQGPTGQGVDQSPIGY